MLGKPPKIRDSSNFEALVTGISNNRGRADDIAPGSIPLPTRGRNYEADFKATRAQMLGGTQSSWIPPRVAKSRSPDSDSGLAAIALVRPTGNGGFNPGSQSRSPNLKASRCRITVLVGQPSDQRSQPTKMRATRFDRTRVCVGSGGRRPAPPQGLSRVAQGKEVRS